MKILLTGGAGYIGSHTAVCLLNAGHDVFIVDNLSNSKMAVIDRIEQITAKRPAFFEGDILDTSLLIKIMADSKIDSVVHFAGLKAVGESVEKPILYYKNNVAGTVSLCEAMIATKTKNLVFSSSSTVYGDPDEVPINEDSKVGGTTNPYGTSKFMVELVLKDWQKAEPQNNVALLRYFNPVGAHESGLIGEDPNGIPNNLMPFITQVAIGRREHLSVFGDDYPTKDGTGIRDYIHVVDLAEGHLKALEKLADNPGLGVWNLGTGQGYSVLDVVRAFEKACKKTIKFVIAPRRPGDIAINFANPSKAEKELNWKAKFGIEKMCTDSWNWQQKNPEGYI